jgi:integrase
MGVVAMKSKSRDNVLTPDEREKLIKACLDEQESLVVHGLLFTGMRVSEFVHMKRSWIDWKDGVINIPHHQPCKCGQECMEPRKNKARGCWQVKTKSAERPIPIVPELKPLLQSYFAQHETVMETIYSRVYAWKLLQGVGKRARLRHKVFPHALRATFATILCEKGLENAVILKDLMGWRKLDMASEYIKLTGTAMKKQVDKIW